MYWMNWVVVPSIKWIQAAMTDRTAFYNKVGLTEQHISVNRNNFQGEKKCFKSPLRQCFFCMKILVDGT